MADFVTGPDRKAREAARRRAAVEAVIHTLSAYARQRGGRFLVFGSAATGKVRHTSDLDLVIDFPAETEGEAWSFVEQVCRRPGLSGDIHSTHTTRRDFLDRIRAHAKVLE